MQTNYSYLASDLLEPRRIRVAILINNNTTKYLTNNDLYVLYTFLYLLLNSWNPSKSPFENLKIFK